MKHLMIYNIGDKVIGEDRVIKKAVDPNEVLIKIIASQKTVGFCFSLFRTKPGDLCFNFLFKILGIQRIVDLLKVVVISLDVNGL